MTRVRLNGQSDRWKSTPRWDLAFLRGRVRNDRQKTMEMFPGISMDPDIRFGKPCITGTRIDVATLVAAVAAGETLETVADIRARG